jgi:hypothetical protein
MENKTFIQNKAQLANNSSGHGGDERHNTEVDRRMYSGEAEIANLVK